MAAPRLTPADQPRIFGNVLEALDAAAGSLTDARRRTAEATDAFAVARGDAAAGSADYHQADKAYEEAVALGRCIEEAIVGINKAGYLASAPLR